MTHLAGLAENLHHDRGAVVSELLQLVMLKRVVEGVK